jgi:hypothetical protein
MPLQGVAEQRALLVGVGKLDIPGNELPSIELDLDRMHEMLNLIGFEDRQIHTLQDEAATSSHVIAEFNGWLKQGVQPNDRVVFYFSGHGSNIPDLRGDQDDNVSQVLVTHDVRRVRDKGGASLAGVLPDYRLSEMLAAIPSRNVLFIVDSCHSGTVTRSFNLNNHSLGSTPVFIKSYNYPGMPAPPPHPVTRGLATSKERKEPQWDAHANYIAITAAADNQEAIGTMNGGVFTLGLTDAVKRLTGEGKNPTARQLRDDADAYIRSKVDKDQVHTPQIMGNEALADAPIKVISLNAGNESKAAARAGGTANAAYRAYGIERPVCGRRAGQADAEDSGGRLPECGERRFKGQCHGIVSERHPADQCRQRRHVQLSDCTNGI